MRLLHSHTLQLHEFFHPNVPPYAILSHRWGSEEISFQDMNIINGDRLCKCGLADAKAKLQATAGYAKIVACCRQAVNDGLNFVWIDTCCIDKSSSAELSEAINSMYKWYQSSSICYAYLNDVTYPLEDSDGDWYECCLGQLMNSRWFTRGWTLQELIAPKNVRFYSAGWASFGVKAPLSSPFVGVSRSGRSLTQTISQVTGIDTDTLMHGLQPVNSIAKRMSWAAKRETTRVEDVAYSLLGIFGVNMPLLYGEGDAAFLRLQSEIMSRSDDQTILAWKYPLEQQQSATSWCGLLATSPSVFAGSGGFEPFRSGIHNQRSPHEMTSRGVRLELQVCYEDPGSQYCFGLLACGNQQTKSQVAIPLLIMSRENDDNVTTEMTVSSGTQNRPIGTALRVSPNLGLVEIDSDHAMMDADMTEMIIYVEQCQSSEDAPIPLPLTSTFFFSLTQAEERYQIVQGLPCWNPITLAVEQAWIHIGAVQLESELKSFPSFMIVVQGRHDTSSEESLCAWFITEADKLNDWAAKVAMSGIYPAWWALLSQLDQFQSTSRVTLKDGQRVHAEILVHNHSRRQYIVRIDIRGP